MFFPILEYQFQLLLLNEPQYYPPTTVNYLSATNGNAITTTGNQYFIITLN
jgi:hypothetical protein